MNRSLLYFILWFVATLTVSSCSDDDARGGGTAGSGLRDITFTLSLSGETGGDGAAATRALTEAEEVEAKDIYVLGFVDEDDNGTYIYTYRAKARDITPLAGEKIQFTIGLRRYDYYNQRFVVLANCEAYGNLQTLDAACLGVDDLETLLPKLLVTNGAEWRAHNTAPTDPMDCIPMYAVSDPMTIDQNTENIDGDANGLLLIRMLARLDVSVQSNVDNFQLVSAELFNRKNMGHLAYDNVNWDATNKKVTVADVPGLEPGFATTKLPGVVYPADATGAVTAAIYTFETKGVTSKHDATALVVGGYYDYPVNQAAVTYYRIDIPKFDAAGVAQPGTFGDLLRNHLYNIQIKSVSQKGAKTSEDAFNGAAVWMEAGIVPWNLADMDDVKFENKYGLKVNKSQFIAPESGATGQQLTIFTDYVDGWEATLVPAAATSWVQFAPAATSWQGPGGEEKTIMFDILADGTQVVGRHAVIRVRAGGITKYVDIFQTDGVTGDIFDWSAGSADMGEGTGLGQSCRLGISRGSYDLTKNAMTDIPLIISTDWAEGWEATATSTGNWITITAHESSSGPDSATLLFKVDENSTGSARQGTISVKAGSLTKTITVCQSNELNSDVETPIRPWDEGGHDSQTSLDGPYSLIVGRSACRYAGDFGGDGSAMSRAIGVTATGGGRWTASSSDPSWVTLNASSGEANGSATSLTYTIQKSAGLVSDRTATITVTVGNLVKEIGITQYPGQAVWFGDDVADEYTDPGLYHFTVQSACPWVANVHSDPDGVIEQLRTSSSIVAAAGSDDFVFSILGAISANPVIRFESIDGEFAYYDLQLRIIEEAQP